MFRRNCHLQGAYSNNCKLPEDFDYPETCSSKLMVKYPKYGIVHVLVLIKMVVESSVDGFNRIQILTFALSVILTYLWVN